MPDKGDTARTLIHYLGLVLEIPPAAYVAVTGQAPMWVRIWLTVWLSVWLLSTVSLAARARDTEQQTRKVART